jgi:anti-sigma regulatory factor (Ser/Thr protein kinase)
LGALSHLGFALRNADDLDGVAHAVLRDLTALPGVSQVGVGISEGGGRRLRFRASDGGAWCHIDAYDDVPLTAVVRTGEALFGGVDDFGGAFATLLTEQRAAGARALAAVPLPGTGSPIGGLVVFFDEEQQFAGPQRRLLEAAARRTAEGVRRVRSAGFGAAHEANAEINPDGQHPDGQHSDGQHPDGQRPDDQHPKAATLLLADDARAPGTARRFLRGLLGDWKVGDDVGDSAQLCLSELVTNAVIHAGTTSVLTVRLDDEVLTVAVRDRGGVRAEVRLGEDDDPFKVFGRGLQLVDALADRWGSEQDSSGTTSWFAISVDEQSESAQTG